MGDLAELSMNDPSPGVLYPRRVYPLDNRELSEEQIAVAFAMTSRRPEPFDEIAREVSAEKAADFHERWVLGYGHASVAEHAVVHLAVENISRLACDTLEDNRLASYTEKSSRYQVMDADYFHVPSELDACPELRGEYMEVCRHLFRVYQQLIDGSSEYLRGVHPQRPRESDGAYHLRIRRMATDACRSVLPASTLTNVGITANARTLEHAISKLMSAELVEERELGEGHSRAGTGSHAYTDQVRGRGGVPEAALAGTTRIGGRHGHHQCAAGARSGGAVGALGCRGGGKAGGGPALWFIDPRLRRSLEEYVGVGQRGAAASHQWVPPRYGTPTMRRPASSRLWTIHSRF